MAQDWAQEPDHLGDLGTLERDFLAASQALRARQQEASDRQASDRRNGLIAAIIVLVVLLGFTTFAFYLGR